MEVRLSYPGEPVDRGRSVDGCVSVSHTCRPSVCSSRAEHPSTAGNCWSPGALQKDGEVLPVHRCLVQDVPVLVRWESVISWGVEVAACS